jgi:hypothetical protein
MAALMNSLFLSLGDYLQLFLQISHTLTLLSVLMDVSVSFFMEKKKAIEAIRREYSIILGINLTSLLVSICFVIPSLLNNG